MNQEPLYPNVYPKRIEQDSQRVNTDVPSPSKKKKKKKNDRTLHASSEPEVEKPPDNDNEVSIFDAETQSDSVGVLGTGVPILACLRPMEWLH